MKTLPIIVAAIALSAACFTQASEITDFPAVASPTTSREAVRAEARAAVAAGARYDFIGPEMQLPVSTKSRDEVRREAVMHDRHDVLSTWTRVGGM